MINKSPKEVLLRSSKVSLDKKMSIPEFKSLSLIQGHESKVVGIQVVEIKMKNENMQKSLHACFVRLFCSLKLFKSKEDIPDNACFVIEAEHDVAFEAGEVVTQEEIEELVSSEMILSEAWPYWKEHVKSMASKVGINPPVVPNYEYKKQSVKVQQSND